MISIRRQAQQARTTVSPAAVLWVAYVSLVACLIALYVVLLRLPGIGVDLVCFRAAALLYMHGGNPYDMAQLYHAESVLFKTLGHLRGTLHAGYYHEGYYNPPLFATALRPLAVLPFIEAYAAYTAIVLVLAAVGAWLVLRAFGWTRYRVPAIAIVLLSPPVFIAARNGQQSTLLLCVLGAVMYALRRGRPELGGALLVVSLVKPHLLGPLALLAPLLLPTRGARLRWGAGFCAGLLLAVILTAATTGPASLLAWLHTLFGYTGYADAIQHDIPSLSGMVLILAPHPWNKPGAMALMAAGIAAMIAIAVRASRMRVAPAAGLAALVAVWLFFAPFAHANDDVLFFPALAMAWGRDGIGGARRVPVLALWAMTALTLTFILPAPWQLLGLAPPLLVLAAALPRLSRKHLAACS